jgi:hypothetical protein
MISDPFDPNQYVENPSPPPAVIPKQIEGLPTTGVMGQAPTIGVGTIVTIATIVLTLIANMTGFVLPPEAQAFFDQYGMTIAAIVSSLVTAGITYFKVFSPHSAAEIQSGVR